ncbi:MAG: sugar transferase [Pseudomonadota bacterium]|nr:sugar transferase [Gammaproteobacteria bacterium]MDQ3583927.1 sugar transferase [Pseudomonadota bacterium]
MYLVVRPFVEFGLSLLALIILSPLLVPVMIILKLTGEHEVIFLQKRIGYKNKEFNIWKFATMMKNSPTTGTGEITLRDDPRVTPVGRVLRKTKINELPQLINVLKGDMSIVGPRPLMRESFDLYSPEVQRVIYNTRPGITGIGSVIFRDEEKIMSESKDVQATYRRVFRYKGDVEMWYQESISFFTDLMIIFLTAWNMVFPKSRLVYTIFPSLPKWDCQDLTRKEYPRQ